MRYPDLKEKLKSELHAQGLTYAELGVKIGLSASGVKKLFLAKDISLGRLNQICEVLGLQISELLDAGEEQIGSHGLDAKAQEYFAKNRECFYFYFLLLTEPKSFSEVIDEYHIEKKRAYRFLKELERLKLVRWLPGDRISTGVKGPFLFRFEGSFIRELVKEWSHEMVDDVIGRRKKTEHNFFSTRVLHLRPESINELTTAISETMAEFSRRSQREKKANRRDVRPVRTLAVIGGGNFIKKI